MAEGAPGPHDRRGLGRGLAALLADAEGAPQQAGGPRLVELPLDAIAANPDQPRATIDEAALQALAASLGASGVLQPVVVAPAGPDGVHTLIAGERRWRAARLAGLERVPAVVREVGERERLELALVENVVREDLTPIDVAQACACLIEDFGQTHADLAGRLGRSRPAISNLVRLLELPEEVQELIADGAITEGHGRAILMADGPARRARLARRVVAEGLSVRATEQAARRESAEPRPERARPEPTPLGDRALEAFGAAFAAPVRVRGARGGQVVVELRFADETALAAALERLSEPG
ncbi:ParB/RepB/Spo0J family partition protein [Miltoncostaea marina]|uniref:ParB/RepB/Spo0J family partition protein n=1 Tax=Miltoncostaea marina TaxID=2843215 RepID=UPI001C3E8309|nr:ParB/RepB/Spo0J family partition protein [Miltoncostaea marina]